jgi:hypothetical protein
MRNDRGTHYHDPRIYIVPLYKLLSIKPCRNRTMHNCVYVLHAAEHMVRHDHTISVKRSHMRGATTCSIRPWGIWLMTLLGRVYQIDMYRKLGSEIYDPPCGEHG